jgi:hypothetical protein
VKNFCFLKINIKKKVWKQIPTLEAHCWGKKDSPKQAEKVFPNISRPAVWTVQSTSIDDRWTMFGQDTTLLLGSDYLSSYSTKLPVSELSPNGALPVN